MMQVLHPGYFPAGGRLADYVEVGKATGPKNPKEFDYLPQYVEVYRGRTPTNATLGKHKGEVGSYKGRSTHAPSLSESSSINSARSVRQALSTCTLKIPP